MLCRASTPALTLMVRAPFSRLMEETLSVSCFAAMSYRRTVSSSPSAFVTVNA